MKPLRPLLLPYLVLSRMLWMTAIAQQQEILVDQSFTFDVVTQNAPVVRDFIRFLPPSGVVFTPNLSSLNFMDLFISDFTELPEGAGSRLELSLYDRVLDTKLGTSAALDLPDGFDAPVRFQFDHTITLIPGHQHYAQVDLLSGDSSWGFNLGFVLPPIPPKNLVVEGRLIDFAWFREGLIVPEPNSAELLLMGGIGIVVCAARYSRKAES
jgi:hypothetical protein